MDEEGAEGVFAGGGRGLLGGRDKQAWRLLDSLPDSLKIPVLPVTCLCVVIPLLERGAPSIGYYAIMSGLNVFVRDGEVYTSPNATQLPDDLAVRRLSEEDPKPSMTFRTLWSDNRYPFLAWVPLRPRFRRPVFDVLRRSGRGYPIHESRPGRWRLTDHRINAWLALESNLRLICTVLSGVGSHLLPLEWKEFPLPQRYGFCREHAEIFGAQMAARRSADAFRVLMAYASALLAHHSGTPMGSSRPMWQTILVEKGGVPPDYVTQISRSELVAFDPSYRRAGVVVHGSCRFLQWLKPMLWANVPVWVHCGPVGATWDLVGLAKYRPSEESVHLAATAEDAPGGPEAVGLQTSHPELPMHTRQRVGETLDDHMTRMREAWEDVVAHEGDFARERRLSRERDQEGHPPPGRRGPRVFWWERAEGGHLIRTPMSREEANGVWGELTDSQRRYNSVTDEWDVYEGWDEGGRGTREVVVVEADWEGMPEAPEPCTPPAFVDTLREELDLELRSRPVQLDVDVLDLAGHRYGFVVPEDDEGARPDNPKSWTLLCGYFGMGRTEGEGVPARLHSALSSFFQSLHSGGASEMPARCWDLSPNCDRRLSPSRDRGLDVVPIEGDGGRKMYLLKGRVAEDVGWCVCVEDAAAALQAVRKGMGPSAKEVARQLSRMGVPFRTLAHHRKGGSPRASGRGETLGYRDPWEKGSVLEYGFYQERRKEVLMSPHGRAAIMKGGLVWRLAMDSIGDEAEALVVQGPCSEDEGHRRYIDIGGGSRLWDDEMSEEELDVVCGVYREPTPSGERGAALSWWPRPGTFQCFGIWSGFWTPKCEEWYQTRLQEIREGRAVLKSRSSWYHNRTFKQTARISQACSAHSEAFLEREDFSGSF